MWLQSLSSISGWVMVFKGTFRASYTVLLCIPSDSGTSLISTPFLSGNLHVKKAFSNRRVEFSFQVLILKRRGFIVKVDERRCTWKLHLSASTFFVHVECKNHSGDPVCPIIYNPITYGLITVLLWLYWITLKRNLLQNGSEWMIHHSNIALHFPRSSGYKCVDVYFIHVHIWILCIERVLFILNTYSITFRVALQPAYPNKPKSTSHQEYNRSAPHRYSLIRLVL